MPVRAPLGRQIDDDDDDDDEISVKSGKATLKGREQSRSTAPGRRKEGASGGPSGCAGRLLQTAPPGLHVTTRTGFPRHASDKCKRAGSGEPHR
eukprot:3657876-Rhodomonas_salina.2